MSRVQLALDVTDLDEAVAFYRKLFGTEPAKRRPGYANFAIADPPLKLVLIEGERGGTLNHLGIEVRTAGEVVAAEDRLAADGVATTGVDDTTCCFAEKTETWVHDPDGAPWEVYVKTADAEQLAPTSRSAAGDAGTCCAPAGEAVAVAGPPAGCC
ncbi:MAG TPA: ArsI/CadI family heavy metal resistance metalloenzyme [Aquihabitans sp.]|jgi:catechol 2,3-dioxygenase-like lactoylglutathione lyase family enzyme|nr:ArsI/CadI family heavy metal resistance metalloenzyme [Aquihabitans sp.]